MVVTSTTSRVNSTALRLKVKRSIGERPHPETGEVLARTFRPAKICCRVRILACRLTCESHARSPYAHTLPNRREDGKTGRRAAINFSLAYWTI